MLFNRTINASCKTLDTLIFAFSASLFNQLGNVTFLRTIRLSTLNPLHTLTLSQKAKKSPQ